ncbi:tRNA (adenosine(37)-N6)-dimethylallyltransferase MiaA [Peptostreptococcus porci]|uniref:tRNA (adenosine(37)-N6)-dimethylallyltransferase MiaA n=1 Tax=Peptostreptococcus porci TaxID=2652282 RepID=UPI0023EFA4CB|nr:tRNA (adenosine(37)-N6)-dimethylallyltransferase MiaA [Peptostreptococcus porci]MDD7182768.1 tRNA (adenosine(37)-N6)-dimethylallyltransferase MiaA [Peptostreptococcus porci]
MNKIPILILTGPTAVGKTKLSIELAKKYDAEIISADSMQIYKYMDIGSAKVTNEEMDNIPHHMIDIVEPDVDFSVSEFRDLATEKIKEIHSKGKLPIVTGGTGLYLNSLIYNMDFGNTFSDESIRDELRGILNKNGIEFLHDILKSYSPDVASRIHPNNTKRVIRAIEVFKLGGDFGDFSNDLKLNDDFDTKIVVLNRDRNVLYNRINLRVDLMFEAGLVEEVERLHNMGYSKDLVSMKGIGYKEIFDVLDGLTDMESAKNLIKQKSRNYAKRQITWFKKYDDALWLDMDKYSEVEDQIKIIDKYVHFSK